MTSDTDRFLGEISGKLDSLIELVRDHVAQDDRRFNAVDAELKAHAVDINQAKGAKAAVIIVGGAVAGAISIIAAAAGKLWHG